MKCIDRLRHLRRHYNDQLEWVKARGGNVEGYIAHYGDPGRAPLDANGNCKTVIVPAELAEAAGLRPVPDAPGCYYQEMFGWGGTKIFEADVARLHSLERELVEYEGRYGHLLRHEDRQQNSDPIQKLTTDVAALAKATQRLINLAGHPVLFPPLEEVLPAWEGAIDAAKQAINGLTTKQMIS